MFNNIVIGMQQFVYDCNAIVRLFKMVINYLSEHRVKIIK
jgi:hypothetical protein